MYIFSYYTFIVAVYYLHSPFHFFLSLVEISNLLLSLMAVRLLFSARFGLQIQLIGGVKNYSAEIGENVICDYQ